jgi:hypothetical protein
MPAPLWQARARLLRPLPTTLPWASRERKRTSPARPGLREDIPRPISSSKRDTGGVPFGTETVNVPLWGNYAA